MIMVSSVLSVMLEMALSVCHSLILLSEVLIVVSLKRLRNIRFLSSLDGLYHLHIRNSVLYRLYDRRKELFESNKIER